MKHFKFTGLIAALTVAFCVQAQAAVPKLMTYQGVLKDNSGNYLTGTYSMVFRIYDVSTSGSALWTETQSTVSVSSGKFSVNLGSVTTLNLDFDDDYWMSIQVGADAEMSPRVRLTSGGYSIRSDYETNGYTEAGHNAMSHKSITGVADNTIHLAKTNFKLDAYSSASANDMGNMIVDTFNDSTGINSGASSNYSYRGSSSYDVVVLPGGVDSYVKLALHTDGSDASTTFTDSSTAARTATAGGNAQIDTAQSVFGGAAGLFDGSGDYVTFPASADFAMGTGDFTVDFRVRLATSGGSHFVQSQNLYSHFDIQINDISNKIYVYLNGTSYNFSWSPSASTWYHIAVVRNGTDLRVYVDGSQIDSTKTSSDNIATSSDTLYIAHDGQSTYLNGWLDEYRISKGIARWTSNFTPPGSAYSSSGSGSATVISNAYTQSAAPTEAMVIADETLGGGSIVYSVSRDNGTTWTTCTKETVTSISSQPSGTQLKWKAVITGDAELNGIAVAV